MEKKDLLSVKWRPKPKYLPIFHVLLALAIGTLIGICCLYLFNTTQTAPPVPVPEPLPEPQPIIEPPPKQEDILPTNNSITCSSKVEAKLGEKFWEVSDWDLVWDQARNESTIRAANPDPKGETIEMSVTSQGHRFYFCPYNVKDKNYERATLRIEYDIVKGRPMNRSYIKVSESNFTYLEIPHAGFQYMNLKPTPNNTMIYDIPINKAHLKTWFKYNSTTCARFIIAMEFGMLSNINLIKMKKPLIMFTKTAAPKKCTQHSCCLTSSLHEFEGLTYHNLAYPRGYRSLQCLPCTKTSNLPHPYVDNLNKLINNLTTIEQIRPLPQIGQCRSTYWSNFTIYYYSMEKSGNYSETYPKVLEAKVPYFNPHDCWCHDDYSTEYEDIFPDDFKRSIRKKNYGYRLP